MTPERPSLTTGAESYLADEEIAVRASGFDPGQRVTLRARTASEQGTWEGQATFEADETGVVDPAEQAPVRGDYDGVRSMGLFQFARETDAGDLDPPETRFTAAVDGDDVAETTVERRFAAEGVEIRDVDHGELVGDLLVPPGEGPHPGVVFLGGSGGGVPTGAQTTLLASRGYAVLSLAYFGAADLPDELVEIPLEYFDRAVEWFSDHDEVRSDPLGVVGGSRGSEAALALAARNDAVRTAVATVPGSHLFQALSSDFSGGSSAWSEDGDPTPFVAYRWSLLDYVRMGLNYLLARPNRFRSVYSGGVEDADPETCEAAALPVEEVGGPVLFVSGTDDELWASDEFGDRLVERLDREDYPHEYEHLAVEGAGHAIAAPYLPVRDRTVGGEGRFTMALGGSPEAYARADEAAWSRILDCLEEGLRTDPDRERVVE